MSILPINSNTTANRITPKETARHIHSATKSITNANETLGITLVENREITATVDQKKFGNFYSHSSFVPWKGRRWQFKLDLPLPKPLDQHTKEDLEGLETAVKQARDLFLADLRQKSTQFGSANFNFVFTEEGYNAFTRTDNYNPDDTFEENVSQNRATNVFQTTDLTAQQLSSLVSGEGCPTDMPLGQYITNQINTVPELQALHKQTLKKPEPAKTNPSNLPNIDHTDNSCFMATTLWYLLDDPKLKEALPHAIERASGSNKDALRVLQGCIGKQHITKDQVNRLITLLGFNLGAQEDARIVIDRLLDLIFDTSYRRPIAASGPSLEAGVVDNFKNIKIKAPEYLDINLSQKNTTPITPTITIPADRLEEGKPQTYKLVKALIHLGEEINTGHNTMLQASKSDGGAAIYYELDDMQKDQIHQITENTFLTTAHKEAVKLLYVKVENPKTAKAFNNSTIGFEIQTLPIDPTIPAMTLAGLETALQQNNDPLTVDLRRLEGVTYKQAALMIWEKACQMPLHGKIQLILPTNCSEKENILRQLQEPIIHIINMGKATLAWKAVKTEGAPRKIEPPVMSFQRAMSPMFTHMDDSHLMYTFDFRQKLKPGTQVDGTRYAIDYRDFGYGDENKPITPGQVAHVFHEELNEFLAAHPDWTGTFQVILPAEDPALQAAFSHLKHKIEAAVPVTTSTEPKPETWKNKVSKLLKFW